MQAGTGTYPGAMVAAALNPAAFEYIPPEHFVGESLSQVIEHLRDLYNIAPEHVYVVEAVDDATEMDEYNLSPEELESWGNEGMAKLNSLGALDGTTGTVEQEPVNPGESNLGDEDDWSAWERQMME